jgi:uncharacterized protein
MKTKYDGFQWDEGNIAHCAKHGVPRDEIEHVLANMTFTIPDPNPLEPRLRTAGKTIEGRHVFVVFMFREFEDERWIRPISARYMHMKEVKAYERHIKT